MHRTNSLLVNIRRIIKLYDSMLRSVCDQYGLAPIEVTIISFLYNNPGRDTAADIVELRMLSKGNVSQAVEGLIQRSLLRRQQDTQDRRKSHLSLPVDAAPITADIELVRKRFQEQVFRGFSDEEREQFALFNDRVAENTKSVWERNVTQ